VGVNNKERRAAKKRQQRTGRAQTGGAHGYSGRRGSAQDGGPRLDDRAQLAAEVADLLEAAIQARVSGETKVLDALIDLCTSVAAQAGRSVVSTCLTELLTSRLSMAWEGGWQPAELVRHVRRRSTETHAALLLPAMTIQREEAADAPPAAWSAQLDELGAIVWWTGPDWLTPWAAGKDITYADGVRCGIETLALFASLRRLPLIGPPPSQWSEIQFAASGDPQRDAMLAKVRALLAKAESTTFEAEAEAFTAKAQELMARYAIEEAVARSQDPKHRVAPVSRRIPIEDPYAVAKSFLLGEVAVANDVQTVWHDADALMGLVGQETDIAAVDALFTSLLAQCSQAMLAKGSQRDRYGRSMTRSYRQSFILAFAGRIGERLREAVAEARAAAQGEMSTPLLPVLADRRAEVDDFLRQLYPGVQPMKGPVATNRDGWTHGRAAAEMARLSGHAGQLRAT
jgi:hypothetical protein